MILAFWYAALLVLAGVAAVAGWSVADMWTAGKRRKGAHVGRHREVAGWWE